MGFTDLFIRRPVLASVLNLLILLIGIHSLVSLPVRQYPKLTSTVVTVTTVYPGATAELMQGFVTTPLQQSIAAADGVEYVTSTSRQGVSAITVYIRLNFPTDVAMTEIMTKAQEVSSVLPKEVQSPILTKSTGEGRAILYVGFDCPGLSNEKITDYLRRQVQPRLATIEGVASLDLIGASTFAMRIWLHPEKMASRSLSANDIYAALQNNNYQAAPGQTKGYFLTYTVQANTDLRTLEEFQNIILKSEGAQVVRLRDVASIELASESYDSIVKMNGKRSVFIGVNNTPNSNPVTVVEDCLKTLKEFSGQFPPQFQYTVTYDSTQFIVESIHEVIKTLLEAVAIVIVVIFLFLGSFRAVLIPIVTIPLSIVGVATFLSLLGFSLNLLTLLAMVLAVGLVVDDAIVVVENVYRHLTQGRSPLEAAVIGAREIMGPIITMTVTLAAVYAPIAFMGGVTGALFREFALTLAGSVVFSGVVALTLSPMMCAKILRADSLQTPFALKVEGIFHHVSQKYEQALKKVLKRRQGVIYLFVAIIGMNGFLFSHTSSELAPREDQGVILMATKAPPYANIDYTAHYTDQISRILEEIPEKSLSFTFAGMGSPQEGFGGMILKPWSERSRSSTEIIRTLQKKLATVTGLQVFAFDRPALPGVALGLPVQMIINTMSDHKVVFDAMESLKKAALASGLFVVVDSDLTFNNPALKLEINQAKAMQMNISMKALASHLALMMGGNYTNFFNLEGRSYKVIPMASRYFRMTPKDIENTRIVLNDQKQVPVGVPIGTFAKVHLEAEPNQLYQFNQLNSATFQAMPFPGVKMGEVVAFLKSYGAEKLPKGFTFDFLAQSRQYLQEGNALYWTFGFAMIVIFLVLAAQFESLRDPFVIMLSVPMSILGALSVLFAGVSSLNIYSQIGLITLVGLITKHGILIVEFANQLQMEEKKTKEQAILIASVARLRPILMTTAAMVIGLVPLLFAHGAGSASRLSIGVVIVAGMLVGTFFTVFFVPAFYLLVTRPKVPLASVHTIQ